MFLCGADPTKHRTNRFQTIAAQDYIINKAPHRWHCIALGSKLGPSLPLVALAVPSLFRHRWWRCSAASLPHHCCQLTEVQAIQHANVLPTWVAPQHSQLLPPAPKDRTEPAHLPTPAKCQCCALLASQRRPQRYLGHHLDQVLSGSWSVWDRSSSHTALTARSFPKENINKINNLINKQKTQRK